MLARLIALVVVVIVLPTDLRLSRTFGRYIESVLDLLRNRAKSYRLLRDWIFLSVGYH